MMHFKGLGVNQRYAITVTLVFSTIAAIALFVALIEATDFFISLLGGLAAGTVACMIGFGAISVSRRQEERELLNGYIKINDADTPHTTSFEKQKIEFISAKDVSYMFFSSITAINGSISDVETKIVSSAGINPSEYLKELQFLHMVCIDYGIGFHVKDFSLQKSLRKGYEEILHEANASIASVNFLQFYKERKNQYFPLIQDEINLQIAITEDPSTLPISGLRLEFIRNIATTNPPPPMLSFLPVDGYVRGAIGTIEFILKDLSSKGIQIDPDVRP